MKLKPLLGLALIALGLIAIVYGTSRHFPVSLIVGGMVVAGGIAVMLIGKSAIPRLASSR